MTVTLNDVIIVARMISENYETSATYDQDVISGYLTDYDEDKNAVAAAIWAEKAAALQADTYNISADNASYEYHQKIENAWYMNKYYGSKRSPKTSLWIKSPDEEDDSTTIQTG